MATYSKKSDMVFRVTLLTIAGSFIYAMYSGIRNNFGIMLGSIVSSSGLSFASVSFILAVGQLIFGLVQPVFGVVSAKRGNRFAFISGVVLTVGGMLLTPLCRSVPSLMFCLGVVLPAGCGAISYGIIMGAVTPKLPAKAVPTVSGIINASSGIGNTVLSPVITSLISTGGLMHAMTALAVPIIFTYPASLFLGKQAKAAENAETAEAAEVAETAEAALPAQEAGERTSVREWFQKALKSKAYIYLMLGFFTCGFHMAIITNHLPTQIQSFGFTAEATAYAFSVYGIVTVLGSVLSGSLCGKFKMKNVLGFYYGLRPVTILLFLVFPKTLLSVTVFTALFGFSGAATVPAVSGIISKAFGAKSLAMLFGLVFFVHQIGGFFGAWLGGICFSITENYTVIWCASFVLSIAASAVSFAVTEDAPLEIV